MKARAFVTATLAAAALVAYAGEDSTDRSGIGGAGPAFYAAPCGLKGFAGPGEKPCSAPATIAQDMSSAEMRAWMEQHMKVMDEMLVRMKDEHRAVMGGTGRH